MPWYGTTAPITNPQAGSQLVTTGWISDTGDYEAQVFVWSSATNEFQVDFRLHNSSDAIQVSQRFVVSGWCYASIGSILISGQNRLCICVVPSVSGDVVASLSLARKG